MEPEKLSKDEYAKLIARAIAAQSPSITEEERAKRLEELSPKIKEQFSGMVPPPYDEGYGLLQMEKALRPREFHPPYPGEKADYNEELVNKILGMRSEKDIKEDQERKKFNKIKALFGL